MKERKSGRSQEHVIEIEASTDEVWKAITEAEQLTRWFCPEARVTPGEGGNFWVSWGEGMSGGSLIEVWEPGRRLRLRQQPSGDSACEPSDMAAQGVAIMDEYLLETGEGKTVLRLVTTGIPEGAVWDEYYEGTDAGWKLFLIALKHYVERHYGKPRNAVSLIRPIEQTSDEAWSKLFGKPGLNLAEPVRRGQTGVASAPELGDLSVTVLESIHPKILVLRIDSLDDGLLACAIERMAGRNHISLSVATYGDDAEHQPSTRESWSSWIDGILGPAPLETV